MLKETMRVFDGVRNWHRWQIKS